MHELAAKVEKDRAHLSFFRAMRKGNYEEEQQGEIKALPRPDSCQGKRHQGIGTSTLLLREIPVSTKKKLMGHVHACLE